jgi:hypothetical protein
MLNPLLVIEYELENLDAEKGTQTSPESWKSAGVFARRLPKVLSVSNGDTEAFQAKRESSSEIFMISSWSRVNASLPSPYRRGICTRKRPIKQ